MRPLKIILAALLGLVIIAGLAAGFMVVAVVGVVALVILWLHRLITGRSLFKVNVQVRRGPGQPRPATGPRPLRRVDAIDIEATPAPQPPKSLEG